MSSSHSRAGRWDAGIDMVVQIPCTGEDPGPWVETQTPTKSYCPQLRVQPQACGIPAS